MVLQAGFHLVANMRLFSYKKEHVFRSSESASEKLIQSDIYITTMWIPPHLLNEERHIAVIQYQRCCQKKIFYVENYIIFVVVEDMNFRNMVIAEIHLVWFSPGWGGQLFTLIKE